MRTFITVSNETPVSLEMVRAFCPLPNLSRISALTGSASVIPFSVLDILGLTLNAFMNSVNRHLIDEKLDRFALIMEMHRDDYLGDIPYFMDRLKLGEEDAKVLALHFTSMGPEAISLYLGIPSRQVRRSFDRIMEAYAEVNIVVDDSVYTADPFAEYRRQLGE